MGKVTNQTTTPSRIAEGLGSTGGDPLWHDHLSAAGAANIGFGEWVALIALPGSFSSAERRRPLGENALRWLEERRHGALVLGHAPEAEAQRLVRISNLPDSFWGTVRPYRSPSG
jgi:hypothetical protein